MEYNPTVRGVENIEQVIQNTDPNVWTCSLCTYNNRRTAQYCETCYDGRPPWFGHEPPSPPATSHEPSGGSNSMIIDPAVRRPRDPSANRPASKAFVDEYVDFT